MSMQKVNVMVPAMAHEPRGAVWAGDVVPATAALAARIRDVVAAGLAALRARRAVEGAARRRARDRAELLSLAHRYASTQPEFAKDLYAAALADATPWPDQAPSRGRTSPAT